MVDGNHPPSIRGKGIISRNYHVKNLPLNCTRYHKLNYMHELNFLRRFIYQKIFQLFNGQKISQGILPDPDQSTSASNNGHPKGGISVASTFSLSPISTSSHEEIHGPKQPSNTSELASSVQRASFDHSGAVNSSVLYSSSFSHQNLHPSQPNFGNISLRSESSTTSTRSFAFPVYVFSLWSFIISAEINMHVLFY